MDRRGFLKKITLSAGAAGAAVVASASPVEAGRRPLPNRGRGIKGSIVDIVPDGVYVVITIQRTTGRRANIILDKLTRLFVADSRSNVLDLRDALYVNPQDVVDLYFGLELEALELRGRVSRTVYIDG